MLGQYHNQATKALFKIISISYLTKHPQQSMDIKYATNATETYDISDLWFPGQRIFQL